MKEAEKTTKMFIAKDGKEFLSREECANYENNVLEKLKKVKYFKYFTNRDLTETGLFFNTNYAAVYIGRYDGCHYEVLLQYLLDQHKGKILQENVQGYGVTSAFEILATSKGEYFQKKPNIWGGSPTTTKQIFLSEIPIDGFPENIKVISKYVTNYK